MAGEAGEYGRHFCCAEQGNNTLFPVGTGVKASERNPTNERHTVCTGNTKYNRKYEVQRPLRKIVGLVRREKWGEKNVAREKEKGNAGGEQCNVSIDEKQSVAWDEIKGNSGGAQSVDTRKKYRFGEYKATAKGNNDSIDLDEASPIQRSRRDPYKLPGKIRTRKPGKGSRGGSRPTPLCCRKATIKKPNDAIHGKQNYRNTPVTNISEL